MGRKTLVRKTRKTLVRKTLGRKTLVRKTRARLWDARLWYARLAPRCQSAQQMATTSSEEAQPTDKSNDDIEQEETTRLEPLSDTTSTHDDWLHAGSLQLAGSNLRPENISRLC